jgi:hypothetical protein
MPQSIEMLPQLAFKQCLSLPSLACFAAGDTAGGAPACGEWGVVEVCVVLLMCAGQAVANAPKQRDAATVGFQAVPEPSFSCLLCGW